jgi:diguanylate cyclase (GGDEF)-like protein
VLESHLESMLSRVKKNSTTLQRFQAFQIRLHNLNSLSGMIEHILEDAKKSFDLDVVSLCLVDEKGDIVRLLDEDSYPHDSRDGLIFLQSKELLDSIFGPACRPFLGTYEKSFCAGFFAHNRIKPASVAITPLTRRGKYLGALNMGSYQADRFDNKMATDFVEHLGSVVGVCLENNFNFEEMCRISYVDTLTGVNNRRFLEQRISEELDRCQRNGDPLSCLFFDIDFFKSVNDKYGHQGGDFILTAVAGAIKTQLRNNDVLARYGGEEFVALLSNINESQALDIAERIRKTIQELPLQFNETTVSVTISIGSSTYIPAGIASSEAAKTAAQLIEVADSALYKAKHNGRNRVENGGVITSNQNLNGVQKKSSR